MGNLAAPLLQALGINSGSSPSSVGVVPPEPQASRMSEAVMGFPSVDLSPSSFRDPGPVPAAPPGFDGGIDESGAMGGGNQAAAMDAIVKGFKPKKPSFWGLLGDQLLKHWGAEPHFAKDKEQANLRRAMEGFTQDPVAAISRIAQIPGYEGKAWDLMDKYQDNERQKAASESMIGSRKENIINRASSIFGSVAPDGSNWPAVRESYMAIMRRNGFEDVYLPEDFDADFIRAQIASGMKLTEQDNAEYKRKNLARMQANTDSQISHRQVQEAQGERRLDQADTAEAGRNKRHDNPVARPKASNSNSVSVLPDGSKITYGGADKKSAQTAVLRTPEGVERFLVKLPNGKWREVAPPKKDK